jgi:hypothetical protein
MKLGLYLTIGATNFHCLNLAIDFGHLGLYNWNIHIFEILVKCSYIKFVDCANKVFYHTNKSVTYANLASN